jgi:UDP-N-acetylmuramyl pentapeptide phosphotransferase/UDP-N-acetylglucosamine-1-phosphate transferase
VSILRPSLNHRITNLIPAFVNDIVMPPLIALIVSGALVAFLIRSRMASLALDHPNKRSLHSAPTPRLGGIGIIGGVAAAWLYAMPNFDMRLLIAIALLTGVSLIDDLRGVGVAVRMLIHLASAALAITAMLPGGEWWGITFAVIATTWMINLYNFMDGMDGLAGGMTVIGFGGYGVAALAGGDFSFAAINLSIAMAALGFLLFNFPPARVFMGDVGAIPLGLLAAIFNLAGWQRGIWPWWLGIVIFSPFIVDASLTLCKRLLRREKVWQAHREHYYQRLVKHGWGHRKTALAEYALMLSCNLVAIGGMQLEHSLQLALLGSVALTYAILAVVLERYFHV